MLVKEYLKNKNIPFKEHYGELIVPCLFNGCDDDSRTGEGHLYFSAETGQYDCKKCGAKGNLVTLAKFLNDDDFLRQAAGDNQPLPQNQSKIRNKKFNSDLVERCHKQMPERIRHYLNSRGISNEIIIKYKIGYGKFYNTNYITIPIQNTSGDNIFLKLRQDPQDGDDKKVYPCGEAQIYGYDTLEENNEYVVICEGELDRLTLISKGIPAITSTAGALTFKDHWINGLAKFKKVYVCLDVDKAGKEGTEMIIRKMEVLSKTEIFKITLPDELGEKGDVTDYFIKFGGTIEDLFGKYCQLTKSVINIDEFHPITVEELISILDLSIKKDDTNKVITFLGLLSAYTEESQFNISFNAPSSSGKTFIPLEISNLFPEVDRIELSSCSPTAFFHDHNVIDDQGNFIVDLSRKILIFLDQPNNELLVKLRPLFSHDKKTLVSKITNNSQKTGLKVKEIHMIGYPSVVFCTANLNIDEQESTRFFVLSPETDSEKIGLGMKQVIKRAIDVEAYKNWVNSQPERQQLIKRILAIRSESINDIKIDKAAAKEIEEKFMNGIKSLQPRHQRDIKKFISLIKALALLNLWWRDQNGQTITANADDVNMAFNIWQKISKSQELGLPPYLLKFYNEVIIPAWEEKSGGLTTEEAIASEIYGLTRQEISQKHMSVYDRLINENTLRIQILPSLATAGLIEQQKNNPNDKRVSYVYPCLLPAKNEAVNWAMNNNSVEGLDEFTSEEFAKSSAYNDGLDTKDDGKTALEYISEIF
ncbi:MAG: hypothetical protein BWY53_00508 [Parcubacteria group bacterium ADurb.Bin326]|nr:MAG: hypothetical protein BWY53_00508 [Parcubacteria group bacterium ADurb.Bin326]